MHVQRETVARRVACVIALFAVLAAAPADAQIRARILRVGQTGAGQHVVRLGAWTTVDVQLTNEGAEIFEGSLRVTQFDRDGDVTEFITEVSLAPRQTRPYSVYVIPTLVNRNQTLEVDLFNKNNVAVSMVDERDQPCRSLVSNPLQPMNPTDLLVLEVVQNSAATRLIPPDCFYARSDDASRQPIRTLHVARIEDDAVPDRPHGLQAAQGLVLDDADCAAIDRSRQEAIVEWVRGGGRLVVAGGKNWQSLRDSALAEVLPVALTGSQVAERQTEWDSLFAPDRSSAGSQPASRATESIPRCIVKPLGTAAAGIYPVPFYGEGRSEPLIWRRIVGRGVVTFVGVSLHDLLGTSGGRFRGPERIASADESGEPAERPARWSVLAGLSEDIVRIRQRQFFGRLLGLGEIPLADASAYQESDPWGNEVARLIAFNQKAGLFVLVAVLFAAGYWGLSTWGTFAWLQRKKWTHQAWNVFALAAITFSALSLGAVWLLRGVVTRVHDVQIVDAWANDSQAVATCLFGVRTPTHVEARVRLPSGDTGDDPRRAYGPVMALPPVARGSQDVTSFVAPATYRCASAGRLLENVSIRATLKEFAGEWQGALTGRIEARLVSGEVQRSQARRELIKPSFIRNNLNVDLRDCLLLEGVAAAVDKAAGVRCFSVGDLEQGAEFREFSTFYRRPPKSIGEASDDADPEQVERVDLASLQDALDQWVGSMRLMLPGIGGDERKLPVSAQSADPALLLLSFYDAYIPVNRGHMGSTVQPSGGLRLAGLHLLSQHMAMLIGFSDEPGPATLELDGGKVRASKSRTMYRILIPIERE